MNYDIIIIGSGPGGYVAAIRASQLGKKVAIIEKAEIGGICLNWGCIPTKALLKSVQVLNYIKHAKEYGININGEMTPDFQSIVKRSRQIATNISNGIKYLFKKNKIDLYEGKGFIKDTKTVEVSLNKGETQILTADHIIIATGARSKNLPGLEQDGKKIIGYKEALILNELPSSMIIVGSGAIGTEFAFLFNSLGTKVTLIEYMPNILPLEDEEVSKYIEKTFKKAGIEIFTNSTVEKAHIEDNKCRATIKTKTGEQKELEASIILSAAGIESNIENIGLEEIGVKIENKKIKVDEFYRTNIESIYAIGDVIATPALAHVASAEGIICVEKIAGLNPEPLDYKNIPSCIYCQPEVASVGLTEKQALEAGYEIKVGKFPFTASGKAHTSGNKDGFVKVIFDAKYGELLGAHMVGNNVTEMISEIVVAKKLETTAHEIIKSVHPHPTMSEAIIEAVAAAYGEAIHI